MTIDPGNAGVLTQITNSYLNVFASYVSKFMHYGKEIFAVLLSINITWIALWYAFDKESLAAGMSDFLKKFTIAIIFYSIMVSPEYMQGVVDTSTQMGLDVTGTTSLDPSSIINIGANVGLQALKSMADLSLIFEPGQVLLRIGIFFLIIFCFMSVALQVAVTQIIATALAMLSCFTLGFSALGATASMARKSIDALIGISFKLLGYYVVIGASIPVFSSWSQIQSDFFQNDKQSIWLCASTLMFWLLSKSLAGVFERVGGGLVGETAGVDFAAMAVSAAKTAAMALNKPKVANETIQTTFNFNNYGSLSGPGSSSPTPPSSGGAKMVATAGGQASNDTYKAPSSSGNGNNNASSTPHTSPHQNAQSHATNAVNQGAQSDGKVINFSEKQAVYAVNKHTYPGMGKDKKPYKIG